MSQPSSTDGLGIASIAIGVLALLSCCGSFVPYIGFLFLMAAMGLSVVGVLLGVVGRMQRVQAGLPGELSVAGIAVNATAILLWVLYWLLVVAMIVLMFVGVFAVAILGQA